MKLRRGIWVTGPAMGMAVTLACAQSSQPSVETRVDGVVQEMESDNYNTREMGVRHMLELPAEALPLLDKIASSEGSDPEAAARITLNIEKLRQKARENAKAYRALQIAHWEIATAQVGYMAGGHRKEAWDDSVMAGFAKITALHDGGRPDSAVLFPEAAFHTFQAAVKAGCDDPLVVSLYLKTGFATSLLTREQGQALLTDIYPVIVDSHYHPALQLQVAIDYVEALAAIDPDQQLWTRGERTGILDTAMKSWPTIVRDAAVPDALVEELAERYCHRYARTAYEEVDVYDKLFKVWSEARPKSAGPWACQAAVYVDYAESLKGDVHEDLLSDEQLKERQSRLATARQGGEKAYALDPTDSWAPTVMVEVCALDDSDAKAMEEWFGRAMQADPDNYEACLRKLDFYRFRGDGDGALAFGHECVTQGRWQGRVPLTLVEAYRLAASMTDSAEAWMAYMQRPEVRQDIESTYEKFLAAHKGDPLEVHYRTQFALNASLAEWWTTADRQFKILGDHPAVGVFKGASAYDFMRRQAEEHATAAVEQK